jgi:NitT/TauT family transport system substrate-binding protein
MRRRIAPWLVLAVASALSLAACGDDEPSTTGGGGGATTGTTTVSVGVIPIIDVAPLYLGIQKGFFSSRGLDVKPVPAQGGAAIVPAVMTGSQQFGFSNVVSLLTAREKGLPLLSVAAGASSTGKPDADVNAVLVGKDSTLQTAKDLEGKKVAINSLNNIGDTTIKAAVEKAGGDPSKVTFVELPFPDMPAQLERGNVDAVWESEPFRSQILGAGGRILFDNLTETYPTVQIAQYFTTETYKSANAKVVESFVAGMNESMEYASSHPDEVRTVLGTYTKLTPEIAAKVVLPAWPTTLDKESTTAIGEAAQKYGTLKKAADVDGLLAS